MSSVLVIALHWFSVVTSPNVKTSETQPGYYIP